MSTKDLLYSLSVKDLEELARKYGISLVKGRTLLGGIIELRERVTRKSDIIDILHESSKISKRVIQEFISGSLSISEEQIVSSKEVVLQRAAIKLEGKDKLREDYFLRLLKAIEEWDPRKGVGYEELYQVDLATHLEKCGFKARMEKGEDLFHILVDDIYPIELKKSPGRLEYDRLVGQISRYVRSMEQAVVVICDVKRDKEFIDFKQNLYSAYGEKVKIFRK